MDSAPRIRDSRTYLITSAQVGPDAAPASLRRQPLSLLPSLH